MEGEKLKGGNVLLWRACPDFFREGKEEEYSKSQNPQSANLKIHLLPPHHLQPGKDEDDAEHFAHGIVRNGNGGFATQPGAEDEPYADKGRTSTIPFW